MADARVTKLAVDIAGVEAMGDQTGARVTKLAEEAAAQDGRGVQQHLRPHTVSGERRAVGKAAMCGSVVVVGTRKRTR